MVVAAIAFSDGESAAATIAATMKPIAPCGSAVTMKRGRISSLRPSGPRQRHVLVIREQHHADQQEQRELREHDEAAQDQPGCAARLRSRRQQPLHEVLIGAVRGQGQRDAADEAGPEACRPSSDPNDKSKTRELAGRHRRAARPRPSRREPARAAPAKTTQRARHVDEHLDDVGPDDRGHAAAHRVDRSSRRRA